MEQPGQQTIEATLIREVLGWKVVESPRKAGDYPAAWWSPNERCHQVVRSPGDPPQRFSPTRSLYDALEVHEVLEANGGLKTCFSRACFDGAVRIVADCGRCEIVAEGRCLPWTLSHILYHALNDGLLHLPSGSE